MSFNDLPPELKREIASYLLVDPKASIAQGSRWALNLALVSRAWQEVGTEAVWNTIEIESDGEVGHGPLRLLEAFSRGRRNVEKVKKFVITCDYEGADDDFFDSESEEEFDSDERIGDVLAAFIPNLVNLEDLDTYFERKPELLVLLRELADPEALPRLKKLNLRYDDAERSYPPPSWRLIKAVLQRKNLEHLDFYVRANEYISDDDDEDLPKSLPFLTTIKLQFDKRLDLEDHQPQFQNEADSALPVARRLISLAPDTLSCFSISTAFVTANFLSTLSRLTSLSHLSINVDYPYRQGMFHINGLPQLLPSLSQLKTLSIGVTHAPERVKFNETDYAVTEFILLLDSLPPLLETFSATIDFTIHRARIETFLESRSLGPLRSFEYHDRDFDKDEAPYEYTLREYFRNVNTEALNFESRTKRYILPSCLKYL